MNFGFFREVELLVDSTKILAAIHAICIVIATLPFIEIAIRRIVIGIAAIAIVAYLIRFGYIFKNDDSVYLLYPVIVLIGDVIFIAWPYLPRPPSSPYQQASQPMNSAAEQASDRHDSRAPAPDYPTGPRISPSSNKNAEDPFQMPPVVDAFASGVVSVGKFLKDTVVDPISSTAPPDPNRPQPSPFEPKRQSPISQESDRAVPAVPAWQNSVQERPQPFSDSGPIKGIALRLKRGQRVDALGRIIFTLDARIDVSAENRALIAKYSLGNRLIYESANREKYRTKALERLGDSDHHAGRYASTEQQAMGAAKSLWRLGQAAVNMAASALALKVTVDSLMSGHHIECKDMTEILDAEEALIAARENLKAEIELATSFTGGERIIDD